MTANLKVISTYQFSPASQEIISTAAQAQLLCISNTEEFQARLREAEVLCSNWIPGNWRELAPNLRWLQYSEAGIDGLQPTGILEPDSGVIVTTAVGINATTISEYVFSSMLMFNRSWPTMVRLQDRHIWPRSANWYNLGGHELEGQTLGIVGLGHIGRRVAQIGRAFGMRILATRRSVLPGEHDPDVDQFYTSDQLRDMLHLSDYVVISVPLTTTTENLIGEAELRAMLPHAYLVNVARGRVIDEDALIRALKEGWIGGAGLDVTREEPLSADSPLFAIPNVILTPHISGVSVRYDQRLAALFADNLRCYRSGEPMINLYDPAREY
jgi:phosphoglycerate dehydrogenase-like enzyme